MENVSEADVFSKTKSLSGVDAVSGATFSSNGILGALAQALSQASGDQTPGSNGEITPVPTQTPSDESRQLTPQPTVSPDTPSDDPSNDPDTPSEVKTLKDGTYTASAYGYSGLVNNNLDRKRWKNY